MKRLSALLFLGSVLAITPVLPRLAVSQEDSPVESPVGSDLLRESARLGMKLYPATDEIKILFRVDSRCMFGDYDAILYEMAFSADPNLILTIEPLIAEDGSFKPVSYDLSKFPLEDGFVAELLRPKVNRPALAGVYLCKDAMGSGSCASKPFTDVREILSKYRAGNAEPGDPADTIYFFSSVLITPDSVYVPVQRVVTRGFEALEQLLTSTLTPHAVAQKSVAQYRKLEKVLASEPLELNSAKQSIVVVLPKNDRLKCRGPVPTGTSGETTSTVPPLPPVEPEEQTNMW